MAGNNSNSGLLVLTRRQGESIIIGEEGDIKITVLSVNRNQVKIGVIAPKQISVDREEVFTRKQKESGDDG